MKNHLRAAHRHATGMRNEISILGRARPVARSNVRGRASVVLAAREASSKMVAIHLYPVDEVSQSTVARARGALDKRPRMQLIPKPYGPPRGVGGPPMTRDPDWEADLRRYPMSNRFGEQQLWAIWVYRFGRRVDRRRPGPVRSLLTKVYKVAFKVVQILSGITLPKSTKVGPGLLIWHPGNIMIHEHATIGANCTLRHGVSIGIRYEGGGVPVLEDDVEIGAYAQILGGIRIGRGAKIGAMAVVLRDVPPGATAVGVPARIVDRRPHDAEYRIEVPEEEEQIEPAVVAPDH
jgi:serine O-acetyltransferase